MSIKQTFSAGYSEKPLFQKLGIREGFRIIAINPPAGYMNILPEHVISAKALKGSFDLIHFFIREEKQLISQFPHLKMHLNPSGSLWISWPKKSSSFKTALDENEIRSIGLKNGLVDVKVCAVNDIWSGLKFVLRLKDR